MHKDDRTPGAGKGVEQPEPSYTDYGSVKWCNCFCRTVWECIGALNKEIQYDYTQRTKSTWVSMQKLDAWIFMVILFIL